MCDADFFPTELDDAVAVENPAKSQSRHDITTEEANPSRKEGLGRTI
jgi:hypothetical protein